MLIKKLKEMLGIDNLTPYSSEFSGVNLDKKNFKTISQKKPSRIISIDGGCLVIADGGSWSLSKIKTGLIEYEGVKKIRQETKEYYLIIVQKEKYEIMAIDNNESIKLELPGVDSLKIEELPAKIMKYYEWLECLNQKSGALIVMDSALNAENDFEKEIIKKVLDKKLNVSGFCKTSRIRTLNGRSLIGLINAISPKGAWIYYPIFENESLIKSFVAKLDSSCKFCYKVELPYYSDFNEVFYILSFFSKDSEMPGYPYPLFKADKLARVNSFEKKKELFNIENDLKRNGLFFDALSNSFHSQLDNKMYKK